MGRSICLIRILAYKMHTDGFCCFDGGYICIFAVRVQGRIICIPKRPITDSLCRLTGIALSLTVAADMEADFGEQLSVDILQRQSAVADHLAGLLQADSPQPETVLLIAFSVPFDPIPGLSDSGSGSVRSNP